LADILGSPDFIKRLGSAAAAAVQFSTAAMRAAGGCLFKSMNRATAHNSGANGL
jgi:hypothetical protein